MGASTRGAKTSKAGRMQAFSHSTCHTTTHTEIPDCIYPFAHMHYVTFPTCILALYLQTVRGTRCNTARSSILIRIFADLRRTRRDTCAAHLQTCEGTWRNTVRTSIHITLYLQTCEGTRCQTSSFNTTSAFLGVTLGEQHTRSIIA